MVIVLRRNAGVPFASIPMRSLYITRSYKYVQHICKTLSATRKHILLWAEKAYIECE